MISHPGTLSTTKIARGNVIGYLFHTDWDARRHEALGLLVTRRKDLGPIGNNTEEKHIIHLEIMELLEYNKTNKPFEFFNASAQTYKEQLQLPNHTFTSEGRTAYSTPVMQALDILNELEKEFKQDKKYSKDMDKFNNYFKGTREVIEHIPDANARLLKETVNNHSNNHDEPFIKSRPFFSRNKNKKGPYRKMLEVFSERVNELQDPQKLTAGKEPPDKIKTIIEAALKHDGNSDVITTTNQKNDLSTSLDIYIKERSKDERVFRSIFTMFFAWLMPSFIMNFKPNKRITKIDAASRVKEHVDNGGSLDELDSNHLAALKQGRLGEIITNAAENDELTDDLKAFVLYNSQCSRPEM